MFHYCYSSLYFFSLFFNKNNRFCCELIAMNYPYVKSEPKESRSFMSIDEMERKEDIDALLKSLQTDKRSCVGFVFTNSLCRKKMLVLVELVLI